VSVQLVLVHSPLVGPATWEGVAAIMAQHGYDVRVPDLRGTLAAGPPYCVRQVEMIAACAVAERNRLSHESWLSGGCRTGYGPGPGVNVRIHPRPHAAGNRWIRASTPENEGEFRNPPIEARPGNGVDSTIHPPRHRGPDQAG
jgi:hypothetical protein